MKLCVFFLIVLAINLSYGQWASRVFLENAVHYYEQVMQETILQLENRGFSNFRLDDIRQSINKQMYKWHVIGNVTYTNGFLVSVQKIDVTDITQSAGTSTVDGVSQTTATIGGRLNIRDMKIGYDVLAELGEDGNHRFTGTFVHTLARFNFRLIKNLHTQAINGSQAIDSLGSGRDRMVYMPANNITQVISRTYTPGDIYDSVRNWGRDIILPKMIEVATNQLPFPPVCLDCR